MKEIFETSVFRKWLGSLRDRHARARIIQRLDRLQAGNPGDSKPIGEGLSELRIDYGPGYRIYYMQRGPIIVVLLCGGDKHDQSRDIEIAKDLARAWRDE
jgi:putative addiction module killer protein